MTITLTGTRGEGKSCVANIIRQALSEYGIVADMGGIKFIESDVAADLVGDRVSVRVEERDLD